MHTSGAHCHTSGHAAASHATPCHTSTHAAAPHSNGAGFDPHVPHPSSSHNKGVQRPRSSSAAPPYSRNVPVPLEDPFLDVDAPVEYFHPDGNGMRKGVRGAAAARMNMPPVGMIAPDDPMALGRIANADPFGDGMVLEDGVFSPLPPRPLLRRGLQIPSRISHITWGFSFPRILAAQGVEEGQWRLFKHELKSFAAMDWRQWVEVIGISHFVVGHFINPIVGECDSMARSGFKFADEEDRSYCRVENA